MMKWFNEFGKKVSICLVVFSTVISHGVPCNAAYAAVTPKVSKISALGTMIDGPSLVTDNVVGIILNEESLTIGVGKTRTIVAQNNTSINSKVVWSSDKPSVAKVNKQGKITGVKKGSTRIRAKLGKYEAVCVVTVVKAVSVSSVKLNAKSKTIQTNSAFKLIPTVKPDKATNKAVKYKSNKPSVAMVTADGVVKGLKKGSATITVITEDGNKKATCKVKVK